MDGDWETVKAKPKAKKAKQPTEQKITYGGKKNDGTLMSGPVQGNIGTGKASLNNQASTLVEYNDDYGDYGDEEFKFETVNHKCAQEVSAARTKANMTQDPLA